MSRTRKICEEINAVVREFGCAYITYNCTGGISVTPEPGLGDLTTSKYVLRYPRRHY